MAITLKENPLIKMQLLNLTKFQEDSGVRIWHYMVVETKGENVIGCGE